MFNASFYLKKSFSLKKRCIFILIINSSILNHCIIVETGTNRWTSVNCRGVRRETSASGTEAEQRKYYKPDVEVNDKRISQIYRE